MPRVFRTFDLPLAVHDVGVDRLTIEVQHEPGDLVPVARGHREQVVETTLTVVPLAGRVERVLRVNQRLRLVLTALRRDQVRDSVDERVRTPLG